MWEEMPLRIRLLGRPEVNVEGNTLRFERKKALALLCYLAAAGGKRSRAELAELLWPESEKARARTDLRGVLTTLRKALGRDGARGEAKAGGGEGVRPLAIDGDLLGLEPQVVDLDLRALEAAVALARGETQGGAPGGTGVDAAVEGHRDPLAPLEGTLGLYRGEFMEGFSLGDAPEFELWLEAERARWRGAFGELCERVLHLQAGTGRLERAIATARLWAGHAPLEEGAHLRLAELLSAAGAGEGALRAYEQFRDSLGKELEIEPSARMRELAGRLREEVEARAPLAASLARSATAPLSPLEVPFMDRREEFGALASEHHASVSSEGPRVVAVIGEAGIGKTRLIEEFLGWVRARGADVLRGGSSEGAGLPYGPLIEAIRPRIERERAPDDLLEDAWLSELSRLLPELKERYPDLPPPASGEGETAKGALFEAIARTVGVLASRTPVVLFLDDMHWADAATKDFLRYAAGRWVEEGTPLLVLIASRPEDPGGGSAFGGWLSSLGRRLPSRKLPLSPLRDEDVKGLVRRLAYVTAELEGGSGGPGDLTGERAGLERLGEWLIAESGGQPFYLVETLKTLLEEGTHAVLARPDGGAVLELGGPALRGENAPRGLLPHSVRDVILSRLSGLSPAAAELLAAGAVLGRGFGFGPLAAVAGLGDTQGLRGLDELVGRRLLREDGDGGEEGQPLRLGATYSFSHEKIRQVVYTEGGQARRWVLHRRAFGVLEERGAPPAELARHAVAGGLAKEAFACSLAAGDDASEVFAVRDALVHYERARDVLAAEEQRPGGIVPNIQTLRHLYTQIGGAYEMADEWDNARAEYETMLALAREAGEVMLEVVALNHLAILTLHHEWDLPRVRKLLEEALRVAEEADLAEALVETECNLADVITLKARELEHSRPIAEKALDSARALMRPDLVARAANVLARVEIFAGRLDAAAMHAGEGAELSRDLAERPAPKTELPSILAGVLGLSASWRASAKAMEIQCLTYLAYVRIYQGRPQEGMAFAGEARAASGKLPERLETMSLWALCLGLQELGEYEEALVLAKRGTERARKVQDTFLLGANLGRLGEVHEALLNLDEARAAYEEAAELGHDGSRIQARFCVLAALSGDWEESHAHARKAREVGAFFNPLFSVHLHHEVEALLRGGDDGPAREEVHNFAERSLANGRDRMSYLRALAVLGEWDGDTERAAGWLREAEAVCDEIGLPGELWQIRSRLAELYERRGESGGARDAFSGAAQTLRLLAQKIEDEKLREDFLSAPRVRRVFQHG